MKVFGVLCGMLLGLCLAALPARAGTLVLESGALIGIIDLDVGGTLWDVTFIDGSCADLYSGCDETSDFPFPTLADGNQAGFALLAALTDGPMGNFDSDPSLVRGCESILRCDFFIGTGQVQSATSFRASIIRNNGSGADLGPNSFNTSMGASFDPTPFGDTTMAVFGMTPVLASSPAPVPGPAAALAPLLLLALMGRARRSRPTL